MCEWKTDGKTCDKANWRDTFNAPNTLPENIVGKTCSEAVSSYCSGGFLNRNLWSLGESDVKQFPDKNCVGCGKGQKCEVKSTYASDPKYAHLKEYCGKFTTNTACNGDMGGLSYTHFKDSDWKKHFTNAENDATCPTTKCQFTDKGTTNLVPKEFDTV